MSSTKIGRCQRVALDRLRRVLRQELANEIETANAAAGLHRNPAPLQRHVLKTPPVDYKALIANAQVWCGIYATTDTRANGPRESGGLLQYTRPVVTDIELAIVFAWLTQEFPPAIARPDGSAPEEWEEMQYKVELTQLRADAYAEALLECALKYGQDKDTIDDIEFRAVRGTPQLQQGSRRPYGIARVSVRAHQSALISGPTRLPDPS